MSISKILPTISPINRTRISQYKQTKNEPEAKSFEANGLSSNAAEALKTQVLYKKSNEAICLNDNLSNKEIVLALKDNDKLGRSFFGFKKRIANTITKAKDSKLATSNFNILLNFKDSKLNAEDIADILMVATSINNKKMNEKLMSEYGFHGGNLNNETINSIYDKIKKQREAQQSAIMQQQMLNQQMMQDQTFQQQMMQQIHMQHVMMTTPGLGIC